MIDASALLAMVLEEPEAERIRRAIDEAPVRRVGAPTLVETTAVLLRRSHDGIAGIQALLDRLRVRVVAMSPEAAREAQHAYARYGKGVGTPGVLNFGDCLAYGIAQSMSEPLLLKGDDFAGTDVRAAPY